MQILKGIVSFLITPLLILLTLVMLGAAGVYLYYTPKLPTEDEISNIRLQVPLRVYDKEGNLMAEYGKDRRIPVEYKNIPENLINAFVTAEDNRFFEHSGIDTKGVLRAVLNLVKTGSKSQGASTITMQLARNAYLGHERTFDRKAKEAFLAMKIEQTLGKKEILETYLNKIYMGHRSYGVAAAAYVYYGKKLDELNLAQMAMIAGLPKAPSRFNPIANPDRAKIRRDYILKRMNELGYISRSAYETAVAEPITAKVHRSPVKTNAPYMAEMARAYMVEKFGEDATYSLGYKVYTTLEPKEQKVAEETLRKHLIAYSRRHGYRGAEGRISFADFPDRASQLEQLKKQQRYADLYPGLVLDSSKELATVLLRSGEEVQVDREQIKWAREYRTEDRRGRRPKNVSDVLNAGDIIRMQKLAEKAEDGTLTTKWRFSQLPTVTGALVSMDPENGQLRAVVGGFDYFLSKFNRATQAKRQPGSSFKPFVYAAALAKGFRPGSIINDAPIHIPGSKWKPENFGGRFYGPTPLDKALAKSRNLVSIRLMRRIGISYTVNFATRFGFLEKDLPANLTLALGTGSSTPVEMARAYSAFANGGFRVNDNFIDKVIDNNGNIVKLDDLPVACKACERDENAAEELPLGTKPATRIMDTRTNYQIVKMMQGVTQYGTAARAGRILKRKDIAGKTGTTNDQRDAWFCGFSPKAVTVAWMGFDYLAPLGEGETATAAALPVWIDFMKHRLAGLPESGWKESEALIRVKIDAETGELADENTLSVVDENVEEEQESYSAGDPEPTDGFEIFDIPPELLAPSNDEPSGQGGFNSGGGFNGGGGNNAPVRVAPEKVEIPEQLF
jgi:penicillin-binding protein 1A